MAYKIAVASSDGVNIDTSFGAANVFDIYEAEGKEYHLAEKREYTFPEGEAPEKADAANNGDCGSGNGCGTSGGCGTGNGCGSSGGTFPKVQLIGDCRCVICKKIGFQITRQLEKLAITGFDVDCTVEEALTKITVYLEKIDNHQSLRGIQTDKA
ncbi:MAG: hypothetical protein HDR01_03650 [Lachnospiraceae bacterium]|nr:hypothetical protein [Lachnospiraceae bacterium]